MDDRIWCHPKVVNLSDAAFRAFVSGIAYSTGFATRGRLTAAQQRIVGSSADIRRELVEAGLWDPVEGDEVVIHDWDEHNSKRDARREADRERKRKQRAEAKKAATEPPAETDPADASAGQSAGRSAGAARVDGSEGSEEEPRAVTALSDVARARHANSPGFQIPETLVRGMP